MDTYKCAICGKEFRRRKRKNDACKCCSRECGFELQRRQKAEAKARKEKRRTIPKIKPLIVKTCSTCGERYIAKNINQKYCSKECSYQHHLDDEHQMYVENFKPVSATCKYCGKEFMTAFKKRRGYCSEKCARLYEKKIKHIAYRNRLKGKKIDEGISLEKVMKRDQGICKLCMKAVDLNDFKIKGGYIVYGNMYPSVDHIIPLARGGLHEWRNVQLTHRICNSMKGTSLIV